MTGNEKIIFAVIIATFLAGLIIQDYYKSTANISSTCSAGSCALGIYEPEIETSKEVVDLNTATIDQLMKIPGVGDTLAGRIIAYREQHLFTSVNELMSVKGIGERTFLRMRQYVTVFTDNQE